MPKVRKNILILISGIMWSGVGIFLIQLTFHWFFGFSNYEITLIVLAGLILGCAIAYFGFSGIANKNIYRINQYEDKVCIWAFQKWQSYFLIALMMGLGLLMRNTPLIPKYILSPIYIGIGLALFVASTKYYLFLLQVERNKNA